MINATSESLIAETNDDEILTSTNGVLKKIWAWMRSKSTNRIWAVAVIGGPAPPMHSYPPQLPDNRRKYPVHYKWRPPATICRRKNSQKLRKKKYRHSDTMACINTFQSCSVLKGAKINGTKIGGGRGSPTFRCRASTFMDGSLRLEIDENPEAIISGEWPENFSLLSYDDLRAYLQSQEAAAQADNQVHWSHHIYIDSSSSDHQLSIFFLRSC